MTHDAWVERDAAVVWHGFTQMSTYADTRPIIVDHAEGHELVDVDGRRYLDAISSLWVTTLGHCVPELDDAIRRQLDLGAHSTMLGNGNRAVIELSEALAAVVPVEDAHFLYASDGAAAVEQALKIAWQYWINTGTPRSTFLAFGGAYHGDTIGALSLGDSGFGTDIFDPLRFPVLRAPAFDKPDCFDEAAAMIEHHASELAAVVVEPLVQGAAGMQLADPAGLARLGAACRAHDVLLICDEVATGFGRTGTLFASEQCGLSPDLLCLGKGITGGYLAMSATVAAGRVFDAFLGDDLGPRTLYHGHSYGGNALAAAVALRHLELFDAWDVLANVRERSEQLRDLLHDRVASKPAVARGAAPRPHGRRRARAAARRAPLGPARQRGGNRSGRAAAPTRRHGRAHAAAHDHRARGAPHRGCARRCDRRGHCVVTWRDWADDERDSIRASGRWRAPRDLDAHGPEGTLDDGRRVVSFASNDYLGLTDHPTVRAAAHDAIDRWGTGSGSARLIVGSRPVHSELERALARWKQSERAALFPTGFAANLGVLTTFGDRDTLVCSDELNHASIIDGCRLSRADVAVYRHCDIDHLDALLAGRGNRRAVVVSDTVFSMDGDAADVAALTATAARHDALLVLDEAHAVLGPHPQFDRGADVLRVGTLSKTLGALGGFVAGPARYVELVENVARPYIFTTALPPADAAAARAALGVLESAEGHTLVARLRASVDRLREGHPSPILPFVCGDEARALDASRALLEHGLLVPAIRPPTVPEGTSRLRVALSAAHTEAQVDRLEAALLDVFGVLPTQ